jgi:hypothetical protein
VATDIYQTLSELNELFQVLLIDMLGLVSGSPLDYTAASYYVRIQYPQSGAPAWEINEDIVFLFVTEEDDRINRQREEELTNEGDDLNLEVTYTRVIALKLVFYGPSSFENAQIVRDQFFTSVYRRRLAQDEIYLIPDIVAPRRVPDPFQGQWWERVDMVLRFNEKIAKNVTIGTIESADVAIYDYSGLVAEIIVEE